MKFLLTLSFLSLLLFSCEKPASDAKPTCFKGRYVATGCWSVIQLIEPLDDSLPSSQYGIYEHTIGTEEVPEQYEDGRPFYFTVTRVDSNVIHTDECVPTKYVVEMGSFSDSSCNQLTR